MTLPTWPRTDVEQIRDARTFAEARVQLDARQPSSAGGGGLALRREVQPTFSVGEALAPVYYGANGGNYTLTREGGGRQLVTFNAQFPNNAQFQPATVRFPSLSDLYLTGYGARRKNADNSAGHKFNLLKVYLGNGAQGNAATDRDILQLPAPFNLTPDGGDFFGGWYHQLAHGVPIQAEGNSRFIFDLLYDVDSTPLTVNLFWTYEWRPSEAAGFA